MLAKRRFAFGYALDNSEFPCYLVWRQRDGQSYALLVLARMTPSNSANSTPFDRWACIISMTRSLLFPKIGIREDVLVLFDLQEEALLSDLHITRQVFLERYGNHQEHFLDQYFQKLTDTMYLLT